MSEQLTSKDLINESLDEEMERKGTSPYPDWLNVKKQLTFYASYHSNPVNIAIHMVCIPMILWSFLLILAHVPLTSAAPKTIAPFLSFQNNAALWYNSAYVLYYFALEPFGALTYLPQAILSQLTVTHLASFPSSTQSLPGPFKGVGSMKLALLVQLFSWLSQFIGHGAAEGRAPALLDNLLQAVVLAPFFSHLEFLFLAFNYNPKLQAEIKQGVKEDKARRMKEKAKKTR
ncbi:hypothetical protein FFLO_01693 [Filobasidium floriforme]|uniref:Endoplasmic reticulum protein n=1 Tax=Filobasidium floriforme TaxID=5210 RepID=A0A8K0NSF4_9TREE|nr:uncharacterized protein HD553DRAFT_309680 [Filobasidium floriforme]KAG7562864.1 hypothetical protein FFLO_01693 [Filobasidium floriforme]KAH8086448.1 hypothetical protein HD553DRAFT_309680 [Filobasidium floriforme]